MYSRRLLEIACVVAISTCAASQLLSAQTPTKRTTPSPTNTNATAEQQRQMREQKRQEAEQKRKQAEADRKAREELRLATQPKTLEFTDYNFRYTTAAGWKVNEGTSTTGQVVSSLTFALPAPTVPTKENAPPSQTGDVKFDISVVPLADGQSLDGFTTTLIAQLETADKVKFETPTTAKLATIDSRVLSARPKPKEPDPARERIVIAARDGKAYVLRLYGPSQPFARVSTSADHMVKSFIWLDMPDSATQPSAASPATRPTTAPVGSAEKSGAASETNTTN